MTYRTWIAPEVRTELKRLEAIETKLFRKSLAKDHNPEGWGTNNAEWQAAADAVGAFREKHELIGVRVR